VIEENTEFEPIPLAPDVPLPPAPTVTVIGVLDVTAKPDAVLYPPAPPPPPPLLPSSPPPPPPPATTKYSTVDGPKYGVLVSLIVKFDVVANMVPDVEPDRIETVNVSAPSVVLSAVGVTVNEPTLEVIVNEPEDVPKSPAFESIDQ
jgi:hypothetical protein